MKEQKNETALNPTGVDKLRWVTDRLRGDGGCPWDKKQNLPSLMPYFTEEAHELIDAVHSGDKTEIKEEIGDVLFHMVLMAKVCEQDGWFDLEDIAQGVADKLERRHPHVFGAEDENGNKMSPDEALANWEKLKAAEKRESGGELKSVFSGVPQSLPALLKAQRMQEKAAKLGFDWPDIGGPKAKVTEELNELLAELPDWQEEVPYAKESQGGERDKIEAELGDLLFSLVNYARFLKISPEIALQKASQKFRDRFERVEKHFHEAGRPLGSESGPELAEMDEVWNQVKT